MSDDGFHSQEELDEIAKRGTDVYARLVKPRLRPEDDGMFVAVDINTGEYEIDEDDYTALTRLEERVPHANIWLEQAGSPAAYNLPSLRCFSDE